MLETMNKISVIDYGLCNLYNVSNALNHLKAKVEVIENPRDVSNATHLILPGVGAFKNGMRGLKIRNLIEPIKEHIDKNKPFLGICLGMQLLATSSKEFGSHSGLNFIPGVVNKIQNKSLNGELLKIPYIGWAKQEILNLASTHQFLKSFKSKEMYTIHSFQFKPDLKDHLLAFYNYGGNQITSIVGFENITGVQFHPEKSSKYGLEFLNNYINEINSI